MSNWGRPYNNQNFCYRPNGPSEQSTGRWQYFHQPTNTSTTPSVYSPQNGNTELYNTSYGAGSSEFSNSLAGSPAMNNCMTYSNGRGPCPINSDVWAKAANSTLVATAGEFIPSATFHQTSASNHDSQYQNSYNQGFVREQPGGNSSYYNSNSNNRTSGNDSNGRRYSRNNSASASRSDVASSPSEPAHYTNRNNYSNSNSTNNQNGYVDTRSHKNVYNNSREYHQRNNGKPDWNKYSNRSGNRQSGYSRSYGRGPSSSHGTGASGSGNGSGSGPSLEEMKSEGRRKLLEEVAGLLTADGSTAEQSSSKGNSSQDEDSKKSNSSTSENLNVRPFVDYRKNFYSRSDKGGDSSSVHSSSSSFSSIGSRVYNNNNYYNSDRHAGKEGSSSKDKTISQRERLTEQLERGSLECLVCYERVRQAEAVWNCSNCYHVLHLRCIIKWANSSRSDNGWRCPACQNVSKSTPKCYYCFCGKMTDPDWNRNDTAHSCGEVCNKSKPSPSPYYQCNHRCTLLCHPGPCPPCITMIQRNCGCGRTSQMVQCGQNPTTMSCGELCCKELNCGEHFCNEACHLGDCKPCPAKVVQVCYCGTTTREVPCDAKNITIKDFECSGQCPKKMDCDLHPCLKSCHPGSCGPCPLDPATVTHCPCGKMALDPNSVRKSCLDPVPTCNEICAKSLICGQPGSPHTCKSVCHEGACPPCELITFVRCRCGHMDQEVPCKDLTSGSDVRCQKKCTKKRSCGKHKCNQLCCIEVDHVCPIPCNHMLTCGQHRCEELCHNGRCKPCWRTSFEELYCECGSSVLYPPVPCGTRPPECSKPCTRQHSCEHPALHNCHSEPNCPPCNIFTAKHCHGMHELRKTVPCHVEEFSCGLPCGKELRCGYHKCTLPCHKGDCLKPGQSCTQPCSKTRSLCGHPCNAPCHEDECPDTPCKETVKVTCECGHRSLSRPCCENNKEYQRIATSLLASKMADVQLGRSIDLQDIQGARSKINLKTLECNDECRIVERNRRISIGLQIRNPDLTSKLTPRYSDFMRGWAKKDPAFCQHVHDKLTELVHLAKASKHKSRSYSFDPMNRDKRQFVHEYCEHFGCESVAYDAEPKRNVVATAQRDKAWLPSYSLSEVIQREMGQRKVPVPTLNGVKKPPGSRPANAPLVRLGQNPSLSAVVSSMSSNQPQVTKSNSNNRIDYFNYNG